MDRLTEIAQASEPAIAITVSALAILLITLAIGQWLKGQRDRPKD